ncbi:hypothetical protein [Cytobacillus pseudoceanisediminis]
MERVLLLKSIFIFYTFLKIVNLDKSTFLIFVQGKAWTIGEKNVTLARSLENTVIPMNQGLFMVKNERFLRDVIS